MRSRGESGVTVVEASFALPILFLFLAAMIDLGMWTLNANQASNAARDGARAGILAYEQADVSGSADEAAIVAAIDAKVEGRAVSPSDVTIECVEPDGDPVSGGCSAARVDVDRIRVDVDWVWPLVTPIAGVVGTQDGRAEGSATMAIVGRPLPASPVTTTTTTPGCSVTLVSALPNPIGVIAISNRLASSLTITFQASGVCPSLTVELAAPGGGVVTRACGCGVAPAHAWVYAGLDGIWSPGTATVRVKNGPTVVATTTFTVS